MNYLTSKIDEFFHFAARASHLFSLLFLFCCATEKSIRPAPPRATRNGVASLLFSLYLWPTGARPSEMAAWQLPATRALVSHLKSSDNEDKSSSLLGFWLLWLSLTPSLSLSLSSSLLLLLFLDVIVAISFRRPPAKQSEQLAETHFRSASLALNLANREQIEWSPDNDACVRFSC